MLYGLLVGDVNLVTSCLRKVHSSDKQMAELFTSHVPKRSVVQFDVVQSSHLS